MERVLLLGQSVSLALGPESWRNNGSRCDLSLARGPLAVTGNFPAPRALLARPGSALAAQHPGVSMTTPVPQLQQLRKGPGASSPSA